MSKKKQQEPTQAAPAAPAQEQPKQEPFWDALPSLLDSGARHAAERSAVGDWGASSITLALVQALAHADRERRRLVAEAAAAQGAKP